MTNPMAADTRHTVFNYEKVAEFYAHQDFRY